MLSAAELRQRWLDLLPLMITRAGMYTIGGGAGFDIQPTAVAIGTLDISQPATTASDSSDYYAHWAQTHFLLDGHHKIHAAAITGRALHLLSLVSIDASLARPEDIERLPDLRRHDDTARPAITRPPQPR